MSEDVESQVKDLIVERCFLSIAPEDIEDEQRLSDDIGLDSIQILEVVVGLEEVFGIAFEDADFDIANFTTVASIADYVRRKAGQ
jgi:acyl carrier protein